MAKRSRRPGQGEPSPAQQAGGGAGINTSSPSSRSTRPRRARRAQASPLERYRTLILGGAAVMGVLVVAWLAFGQGGPSGTFAAVGPGYACDTLLTPGPVESLTPRPATPTPSPTPSQTVAPSESPAASGSVEPSASPTASPSPTPEPTARLGFTTTVLGREHVRDPNQTIEYGFCPPNSGPHINATNNRGPIRAGVYPRTQEQAPGGWIHNLEHGYTVALYRCTADDCPSDAEMAQLQAFYDQAPTSVNPACPTKVIVARFDGMATRFALLAWGRALVSDEFDLDTALTFAQQWTDHEAVPERGAC